MNRNYHSNSNPKLRNPPSLKSKEIYSILQQILAMAALQMMVLAKWLLCLVIISHKRQLICTFLNGSFYSHEMAINVKPNKWQHFGLSKNQSFSKNLLSNQRMRESG